MSTIPKFASNKKYWQILNKLVFGVSSLPHKSSGELLPQISMVQVLLQEASSNQLPG